MRFTEQNKKKFNPRYFLNEADNFFGTPAEIKPRTPEEIERQQAARKKAMEKAKQLGLPYTGEEDDDVTTAAAPSQPSGIESTEGTSDTSMLGYKPPSLSDIASSGKGIRCAAAAKIQDAMYPLVAPLVPDGPRKMKILRRLKDGVVGPSTASVYNYIAKTLYGLETVPVNQEGFQKICNLNQDQLKAIAAQAQYMDKKVVKAYLAAMEKSTATQVPTSATEPAKKWEMPPGGLYQRTPREAAGRDPDEENLGNLKESKTRKTSYMKLNEQKHKKLFKMLIEG